MRKVLLMICMAVVVALVAPLSARAGGSDNPFPLNFPLPFPWGTIEGTWVVEGESAPVEFVFEIARNCDSREILKVAQIDPSTGKVVAEGIGYRTENATTVYAAMKGHTGGSYVMAVGAYKDSQSNSKRFFAMRLFPFGSGPELRYRITKRSSYVPNSPVADRADCFDR